MVCLQKSIVKVQLTGELTDCKEDIHLIEIDNAKDKPTYFSTEMPNVSGLIVLK